MGLFRNFYTAIIIFIPTLLSAQSIGDTLKNGKVAFIETSFYAADARNNFPFWLRSNQYGTILRNTNTQTSFKVGAYYDRSLTSKVSFGLGFNGNFNINDRGKSNIIVPEIHATVKSKEFELLAGRKRELFGLADKTLSSGSYVWSGNALPLPKLQISIPEYKPILGKGLVSVKGNFAHGWFGDQSMVDDYFMHQKSLYGRLGRDNWKVRFHGGFNHQAQWGGKPTIKVAKKDIKGIDYPSDLKTYSYVVTGASLIRVNERGNLDTSIYSDNDAYNRVGNHLGSLDVAFEVNLKKVNVFLYRQQIYDDGKIYYAKSLAELVDGLSGLAITLPNSKSIIKKIVLEHFYSADQGKVQLKRNPGYGFNNYLSHGQYPNGWSYDDYTIGTPFITTRILESNNKASTAINRINAFYGGLQGGIHKTSFELRTAYRINVPPYNNKIIKQEEIFSGMIQFQQVFIDSRQSITAAFYLDDSDLQGQNRGMQLSYRFVW